jgi:hypothetical protein
VHELVPEVRGQLVARYGRGEEDEGHVRAGGPPEQQAFQRRRATVRPVTAAAGTSASQGSRPSPRSSRT